MKNCPHCKQDLELDRFYQCADGLHYICKECDKKRRKQYYAENKAKLKKQQREYHHKYPEKNKENKLKNTFGMSLKEYYVKLYDQSESVQFVKSKDVGKVGAKYFAVDHCHTTGKIRGLLCLNCNHLIGHAKEKNEVLNSAIEYLNYWRSA